MARRVAIIASGIYSPLSSVVELARRARAEGYDIKVFAPKSAAELLSLNGFSHHKIRRPKIHTLTPLLSPLNTAEADSNAFQDRLNAAVTELGVGGLKIALRQFNPDAIFVDCEMHAHIIVALSMGLPVVQYSNMFLSPPGLRAPPLHKRSYPGSGLRGSRLAVMLTWALYLSSKRIRFYRNKRSDLGADHPTALTELARRQGVPIKTIRRINCWQMPWTYKIPTVLLLPQALDLPTRPYAEMEYLGPMILTSRPEGVSAHSAVERFCNPKGQRKRIFVGFGSMMKPDSHLVRHLMEIARRRTEWIFLGAAGKKWGDIPLEDKPDNIDFVPWVPQTQILRHADLAIMHGGTGGLVEAVDAATPMLIFPHVNDQKGGAARVIFHGIGRAGRTTDPVNLIEKNIDELLRSDRVLKNCRAMQAACRVEKDGQVLERYLRRLTEKQ
ncbi:nucleotide disphospho-sugar-binding domain-containing protein [Ruegeria arenilitoris]|uniref:nucleotide disphospho-sugar-binding domain-containing protein n=1 Tax=Ruegeria arenilitoris TaxID=1173585 RepID=UPI00147AB7A4|nr:glycosyltransferase [Ruegeria arenilitoris]